MTPAAKAIYIAALFVGLSAGSFGGFYTATQAFKQLNDDRRFMAPIVLRDYGYVQYVHADQEHARAALQTAAALLGAMEMQRPEKTQRLDLAVTYSRLAVIEDRANNQNQSHEYMTKARSWYAAFGWRVYSEAEIRTMLKTFDDFVHR